MDGLIKVRFIRSYGDRRPGDSGLVTDAEMRTLEALAVAVRVRSEPVRRPITSAHTVTKQGG